MESEAPQGLKAPVQARSRRTLDRILQAALALIGAKGVEGTSVKEIVDRAGSSVGSFYARFGSKDDLVRYLEDRVWSDAIARWDEGVEARTWEGESLRDVIEGVVRLLVRVERTDLVQRRAFAVHTRSEAGAHRFKEHVRGHVRSLLLAHRGEMTHPDAEHAVRTLWLVLTGAAKEIAAEVPESEYEARSDAAAELTRMAIGYLRGGTDESGPEARPADEKMDFFDVWG